MNPNTFVPQKKLVLITTRLTPTSDGAIEASRGERKYQDLLREARDNALNCPPDDAGVALDAMFAAAFRYARYWERQFRRVDRTLMSMLASDELPDSLRTVLIGQRFGRLRDAKLLTDQEAALIKAYRAMTPAGRAAVRQVASWASVGVEGGVK